LVKTTKAGPSYKIANGQRLLTVFGGISGDDLTSLLLPGLKAISLAREEIEQALYQHHELLAVLLILDEEAEPIHFVTLFWFHGRASM
jgi:hypothetical protein